MFGGSLGARRLNTALAGSWRDIVEAGWQILHAVGEKNTDGVQAAEHYVVVPYLDRMDLAFAAADLIVARAGAATVSEISALGIPAVYVPYAVGNGEQAKNAASAAAAGAAIIIPDAEFTSDRVRGELVPLLEDDDRRERMAAAAAEAGSRTGTEDVITLIDEALQAR